MYDEKAVMDLHQAGLVDVVRRMVTCRDGSPIYQCDRFEYSMPSADCGHVGLELGS